MIYILTGNDTKKKNAYLKKLCGSEQPLFVPETNISKEELFEQASSFSLFGGSPIVVIENFIKEGETNLSEKDLEILKESKTIFIFIEDKLLATDIKKYKKYSDVEDFSVAVVKQISKTNIFGIADAYAKKDKIGAWVLYREAILSGVSPEEISGILFWKIKTMILTGAKIFTPEELKNKSSELVSLYHKSHKGECDFVIGLEQFILSSLSKN